MKVVHKVWDELPGEKIEDVWLSVVCCMRDSLSVCGDDAFSLKHMNKAALRAKGALPVCLNCPHHLIVKAHCMLDNPEFHLPKEKKGCAWMNKDSNVDSDMSVNSS